MRFVLALAIALGACAELNRPMATPGQTPTPPPAVSATDAGAVAPSVDGGPQPGDVQL